jgi:hypothetical protein
MIPSLIARSRTLRAELAEVLEHVRALIWPGHQRRLSEPARVLRPIAGGADSDESLILGMLGEGGACLDCLVSTTGLPMSTITGCLRRLHDVVILTVGLCSKCGADEERLLCRLARRPSV